MFWGISFEELGRIAHLERDERRGPGPCEQTLSFLVTSRRHTHSWAGIALSAFIVGTSVTEYALCTQYSIAKYFSRCWGYIAHWGRKGPHSLRKTAVKRVAKTAR